MATLFVLCALGACASDAGSQSGSGDGSSQSDGSSADGDEADGSGGDGAGDGGTGDGGTGDGGSGDGSGDGGDGDGASDGSPYDQPGLIAPSVPRAELVDATVQFYKTWKSAYLEAACESGQKRIHTAPDTDDYTVSEGHGYGMLFLPLMAAHDDSAQSDFDQLFAYYDTHQSEITDHLMSWAQDDGCGDVSGANSATDGDLDIAYALLLADKVWGSSGDVNYAQEAKTIISAILAGDMADGNYPLVGDWVHDGDHYNGTRASDFMPSHFRAFAEASGETRFDDAVDTIYGIVQTIQTSDSSSGLLPDFIQGANATPRPADGDWLESSHDGDYHYNACRVPWRLASDYVLHGDARARTALQKMNAFIREAAGGDPNNIVDGYKLSGDAYGRYAGPAFVAPFMVAAMIEPASGSNQEWLDALWDWVANYDAEGYYGDSIKLGSMIVVSGLWKAP